MIQDINNRNDLRQYLEEVSCEMFVSDVLHHQYDVLTIPTYMHRPKLNQIIMFMRGITQDTGIPFHAHPNRNFFQKMLLMKRRADFQSIERELQAHVTTWDPSTCYHVQIWLARRTSFLYKSLLTHLGPTPRKSPFHVQEWRYEDAEDAGARIDVKRYSLLVEEAHKDPWSWSAYLDACWKVLVHSNVFDFCVEDVTNLLAPLQRGLEEGVVQRYWTQEEIDQCIGLLWNCIPDSCIANFAVFMTVKDLYRSDIYADHKRDFPLLSESSLYLGIQEGWYLCYNDIPKEMGYKEIEILWQ